MIMKVPKLRILWYQLMADSWHFNQQNPVTLQAAVLEY
jgi:hypothetical protein